MKACMDGVRWSGTLIKNQAHCKAEGKLFFSSRHFRQSLPIIHSFITFIYICKRIPFTLSPINPLSFTKSEHSSTHIHTHTLLAHFLCIACQQTNYYYCFCCSSIHMKRNGA